MTRFRDFMQSIEQEAREEDKLNSNGNVVHLEATSQMKAFRSYFKKEKVRLSAIIASKILRLIKGGK